MNDDHDHHRWEDEGGAVVPAKHDPYELHDFIRDLAIIRHATRIEAWLSSNDGKIELWLANPFKFDYAYTCEVKPNGLGPLREVPYDKQV